MSPFTHDRLGRGGAPATANASSDSASAAAQGTPGSEGEELKRRIDRLQQELSVTASDLDNLLRNINVGVLLLDEELRIRRFTPAIEKLIRLTPHDIGRSVEPFAPNLGSHFLADARRAIETGKPSEREARSAQGSWLLARLSPYVTPAGKSEGVVAAFFDMTPIKNANEMTRVVNRQLAHANKELSCQREEMEEMFSVVAHDLKRPVLALDGLLALIDGDAPSAPDARTTTEAKGPPLLGRARAECARMRQMLADLEGICGIRHRPIVREAIDARQWLGEIVESFQSTAPKHIRIVWTCDRGSVLVARSFLEEVVVNLIENALKYGCTDPQPRITVSGRLGDGMLTIVVADNGKGIAPEHHQKIFEPFRRLDPAAAPGSGVGLLAVKRLLQRLEGELSLESAPGKGAAFTIRIPLPDERAEPLPPRKLNILLVEDDLLDARVVERCLRGTHTVTRVQEMSQAEICLGKEHYDAVLLDLSLPDGHGLELVSRIRNSMGLQTPIVVITGHGEGLGQHEMDAILGAFLSKSDVSRERLLEAINKAIGTVPASPRA